MDVIKWLVQVQSRTEEKCEQIRIQHEKLDFLVVPIMPCIFLRPKRGLRHIVARLGQVSIPWRYFGRNECALPSLW